MIPGPSSTFRHPRCGTRGFTLVELIVALAIALFLLGGLAMILQNTRKANVNQQSLAMLQDEQRFAMTVLTDVIQQGGYYPSGLPQAQTLTQDTALLPAGAPFGGQVAMQGGQAFDGSHPGGAAPDSLTVRFMTTSGDGLIRCDGSSNTAVVDEQDTNVFSIVVPAGNVPGQLQCSLNGNAPVTLVNGIQNLVVYFGVNRNAPGANYNVDTYLTADQMNAADWMNVSSVRIVLWFTNPLAGQPGQQPTILFERVVPVMGRAGYHS